MSITAPYAEIAPTVAALKALTPELRCPNHCLFVPPLGSWVYYSATSTAAANDTTIFAPNDGLGRWILAQPATAPSGGSSGGSGGSSSSSGIPSFTRNYDPADPSKDLITFLGTIGETGTYFNAHPAKITVSASAVQAGFGSVALLTDRIDGDFLTTNAPNSSIQVDFTASRTAKLTGVGLKSRVDDAAHPASLTIEGSNDGTTFTSIFVWTSIGYTAPYQWRYTTFPESPNYRYIRIRQHVVNASGSNFLGVSEVNLYGTLSIL